MGRPLDIVVADRIAEGGLAGLRALGNVRLDPSLDGAALAEACATADVLVVRSTKVGAAVMDGQLALVVRAGAGTNTIDVAAAARRGVFVANCPGKNAQAVAELALGLMVSVDRQIGAGHAAFTEGQWRKKALSGAPGLAGKRVGVVGCGRIGQAFAQRAAAFEVELLLWSRSLTDERAQAMGGTRTASLEALFEAADIVSLHLALTDETRGLVGAQLLERLAPGAMLINTSRAEVVDEAALVQAVTERGLRVGTDVIANEPKGGAVQSPLQGLDGVVVTPHIGASTRQAQDAVAAEVVRVVAAFAQTGEVPNCVNLRRQSPATHQLLVRHRDRPGALAQVLGAISHAELNVEEMANQIFEGGQAACATILLSGAPDEALMRALQAQRDVLGLHTQVLR